MATTPVTFTVESDDISPHDLGVAFSEFANLLAELDAELSPTHKATLSMRVTGLSLDSPATMVIDLEPVEDVVDTSPRLVRTCFAGIRMLERQGRRHPHYPDEALESIKVLTDLMRNGDRSYSFSAPTLDEQAAISQRSAARIDGVLGEDYTSIGSVEGVLETISVHGRPYFTVYDAVGGRAVRCDFAPEMQADVLAALATKVMVEGKIRRDPHGHPQRIRPVESFVPLGTQDAESVESLAGSFGDIEEDASSYLGSPEEAIRRVRDAQ